MNIMDVDLGPQAVAASDANLLNKAAPEFVGRGWCFPPVFDGGNCQAQMISGDRNIQTCLKVLLATRPGERVMRPDYGCDLHKLIFSKINTTTISEIKECVKRAIIHFEPRITIKKIEVLAINEGLQIHIDYIVRTTNSRSNVVYPFYFLEGTHAPK